MPSEGYADPTGATLARMKKVAGVDQAALIPNGRVSLSLPHGPRKPLDAYRICTCHQGDKTWFSARVT
jgi:hypothetical protein